MPYCGESLRPELRGVCSERWVMTRFAWIPRFAVVGLLSTGVFYALLWFLVERADVPVLVATSVGFVVVTVMNYVLHYHWTFGSDNSHVYAFPKYVGMTVIGYFLNYSVMYMGVQVLEFNYLVIQAFAIAAVVSSNLYWSSRWIF